MGERMKGSTCKEGFGTIFGVCGFYVGKVLDEKLSSAGYVCQVYAY
jgi:hypothetical protein